MVEDTIVQENDGKSTEPQKAGEKTTFSVDILRMIRDAQKQHGLRHGDYQRYRGMFPLSISLRMVYQIEGKTIRRESLLLYSILIFFNLFIE